MTLPLRVTLAVLTVALALLAGYWSLATFRANAHLKEAQDSLPLGRYDAALAALSRARALTPGDADLALEQGKVNYLLHAFRKDDVYAERAFASFRDATRLNPLDSATFNNLGWSYMLTDRTADAETAFEAALARDPHNVYYLYSLGKLRERQGDLAGARDVYTRAVGIKRDPRVEARLEALTEE